MNTSDVILSVPERYAVSIFSHNQYWAGQLILNSKIVAMVTKDKKLRCPKKVVRLLMKQAKDRGL